MHYIYLAVCTLVRLMCVRYFVSSVDQTRNAVLGMEWIEPHENVHAHSYTLYSNTLHCIALHWGECIWRKSLIRNISIRTHACTHVPMGFHIDFQFNDPEWRTLHVLRCLMRICACMHACAYTFVYAAPLVIVAFVYQQQIVRACVCVRICWVCLSCLHSFVMYTLFEQRMVYTRNAQMGKERMHRKMSVCVHSNVASCCLFIRIFFSLSLVTRLFIHFAVASFVLFMPTLSQFDSVFHFVKRNLLHKSLYNRSIINKETENCLTNRKYSIYQISRQWIAEKGIRWISQLFWFQSGNFNV